LAKNSASLNKKFGTAFKTASKVEGDERIDALNKGFVRIRTGYGSGGAVKIELNQSFFRGKTKQSLLNYLLDNADQIDSLSINLTDKDGNAVDSVDAPRLFDLEDSEKIDRMTGALEELRPRREGSFLPGTELDLGLPSEEQAKQSRVARRVKLSKQSHPEAIPLKYQKNDEGDFIIDDNGKPKPAHLEYKFDETPVAKAAAKGIRNPEEREKAIVSALGDKLSEFYNQAKKNPEIKAGEKWYSTARVRLKKLLGDDSKFFSELLGATSARTPVEINFRFALDAYNQFKQGKYDELISKYREGKLKWEKADLAEFTEATGNETPTRGQFLDWWVQENNLIPLQSNGKKFGANSRPVLRVLDGSWADEVQGPKTPNFAGNLTGSTFEATIDVWAARALHRLANEGAKGAWRILPEMETGVTDSDFALGQAAFKHAADKAGIKPDALQAILWFAEKDHWEKNGWTRAAGAEKSDFNSLFAETERTKKGTLQTRKPQLDFSLELADIQRR
jgi:hypothetical protein